MTSPKRFTDTSLKLNNDLLTLASEYLLKHMALHQAFVEGFQQQCNQYYLNTNNKHNVNDLVQVHAEFMKNISEYTADHLQESMSLFSKEINKGVQLFSESSTENNQPITNNKTKQQQDK